MIHPPDENSTKRPQLIRFAISPVSSKVGKVAFAHEQRHDWTDHPIGHIHYETAKPDLYIHKPQYHLLAGCFGCP
jgi:hypothetical protein